MPDPQLGFSELRTGPGEDEARVAAASLVERSFWQEYLQQTCSARFESVDASFHEQLTARMDEQTVMDGERVTEMNRVRDERQAAQGQLMEALTLAALEPRSEPQAQGGADDLLSPIGYKL